MDAIFLLRADSIGDERVCSLIFRARPAEGDGGDCESGIMASSPNGITLQMLAITGCLIKQKIYNFKMLKYTLPLSWHLCNVRTKWNS